MRFFPASHADALLPVGEPMLVGDATDAEVLSDNNGCGSGASGSSFFFAVCRCLLAIAGLSSIFSGWRMGMSAREGGCATHGVDTGSTEITDEERADDSSDDGWLQVIEDVVEVKLMEDDDDARLEKVWPRPDAGSMVNASRVR